MANIRIPTYERQVEGPQQKASQAKAPEPLRQAYGENVAQATGQLGKAMMQLGDDLIKIQAKNNKDRILLETGKLDIEYKKFQADLKNRDDYQNFSADTDNFLDTQLTNMKNNLGDELFDMWYKYEGQLFVDTVKAQTDIMKVPASIKQENNLLNDKINQTSYNYAITSGPNANQTKLQKDLIKQATADNINSSFLPEETKKGLMKDLNIKCAKADIDTNIYTAPNMVKERIKSGWYKGEDGENYLTPKQEADYLKKCDMLIKQYEGTIYDDKISPIYQEFNDAFDRSESEAQDIYDKYYENRTLLREKGVKDKDIPKVLKFMEGTLKGGDLWRQSQILAWDNSNKKSNLVSEDKKLAKTGEYANIEDSINYINETNDLLNSKSLNKKDKVSVIKNRNEIYERLGYNVRQEGFAPTTENDSYKVDISWNGDVTNWIKATNSGYLLNELKNTFVKSGMLKDGYFQNITDAEVGQIYANAYKYCGAMNMSATRDADSSIAIQDAISKSLTKYVMERHNKTAEQAQEILIGNHILKLRKDVKDQAVGFTLNSYKD